MNKPIFVTGIKTMSPDPKTDVVRIGLLSNGEAVTLHVHKAVLAPLVLGLMRSAEAFHDPNATETLGQSFTLSNARPFVRDTKTHGLELTVDGNMKISVIFPVSGIEIWRQVVKHLEAASKSPPKRPVTH